MGDAYETLESIRKRCLTGEIVDKEREVLDLLLRNGIKARQDDGELWQTISSVPKSIDGALVIGLRYLKKDGTYTEDHFLCKENVEPGQPEIERYYMGALESILPEYKGAHKQQNISDSSNGGETPPTEVNTISYWSKKS